MTISWLQAAILGIFASLSSMPGMGGSSIGNYTLGRPLVGGLVCGLILGDVILGIICGVAMQLVYIALVTPGGTVSADVRAVSYIGIPLAMVAIKSQGISDAQQAADFAKSMGVLVGTLGTVLFYGTATMNLVWQHMGWKAVEQGEYKKLYAVDWYLPWVSHFLFSFLPTLILCRYGADAVTALKDALPMDGLPMKTLFTVGSLLPCVGIAILLKQIVEKVTDFVGFTLAASLGLNLVSSAVVSLIFALLFYEVQMAKNVKASAVAVGDFDDDDEEDI